MPSAMPKSPYKFTPYILGPRQGRVHLDNGAPPWFSGPQPVPGMVGVNYDQLNAPPPAPAPPPQVEEPDEQPRINPKYAQAIQNKESLYAERPVQESPHWWQRGIAGALGGLAGWSNAAGRTKRPIDVTSATENILHPGYQQKLQIWQDKLAQAQGPLDLEAARQNAELKAQQIAGQAESRSASADWRRELANPHHNQQQLDPAYARENFPWMRPDASGQFWVDKTVANTIQKPVKEAVDRGQLVSDPGLAGILGVKTGEYVDRDLYKAAIQANTKQPPNRNELEAYIEANGGDVQKALGQWRQDQIHRAVASRPAHADPFARMEFQDQMQTKRSLNGIEAQKGTRLNQLEAKTRSEVAAAKGNDQDIQRIYAEHEALKQAIQNEYEGQVATASGSAQPHFQYGTPKPAGQPQRPSVQVGQQVMVGGRPATVTGINPQTGKPIVKFQ